MRKEEQHLRKINLGCGTDYREGFINVENSPFVKKDVECDLNKYPYPFDDESIDEVHAYAVMENLDDIVKFMDEVYRILKPGGMLKFRSALAFTYVDAKDPTHKQHFIPGTFNLWLKGFNDQKISKTQFKGKLWVTIPFFHKLRFPASLHILNSFVNNIFTGIEGEFIK